MIVIPMAGVSRRFTEAGYARPKYELVLDGRAVFDQAIGGFEALFAHEAFLFIVMDAEAAAFVTAAVARLGIADACIARLGAPTAGQAETVSLGLAQVDAPPGAPLTIFNIDTFRPNYRPPAGPLAAMDGWLEVFRGEGANWSYVRPAPGADPIALETAEKRPISDLCCTGLYHFARAADIETALAAERAAPSMNELYVAPLYNHLIGRGLRIGYRLIAHDEVVFCGTPEEYQGLGGPRP